MKSKIYISCKVKMVISLFTILLMLVGCNNQSKPKTEKEEKAFVYPSIPVGKGPDALFLTPDKSLLYVANVEDTTISIIHTGSEKVVKTINGIGNPWGFVRLGKSNLVAVSAYDKQLVLIDFSTHIVIREQYFDSHLGGITADKNGKFIYVISIDDNLVLQLDAHSFDFLRSYPTGNAPDGIGISKNDNTIFVTNTGDGTISVIDVEDPKQKTITTGGKPELVHSNQDHSLLFISNFLENKIHVLDTDRKEIITNIEGIKSPEEAVLSMDEKRLYIVSFEKAKINVYDGVNYENLNISYPTGKNPIGVMPVGAKLFVSNYGDNSISVISLKK